MLNCIQQVKNKFQLESSTSIVICEENEVAESIHNITEDIVISSIEECLEDDDYVLYIEDHDYIDTMQGENKVYFRCAICSSRFTQKPNLKRHYEMHMGKRNFKCNLCSKRFTQKSNLKKHEATHKGERNFSCHICHKKFTQKPNLARHLRIHTGEKPFKCELCGHEFIQKTNLSRHLESHKIENEISKNESYVLEETPENIDNTAYQVCDKSGKQIKCEELLCDQCPTTFKSKRSLSRHIKCHRLMCDECPAKFKFQKSYEKHKKCHM